jgi:PAS domain S-box-containing protein
VAVLLRRALENHLRFNSLRELGTYCLVAAAVAPLVGATLGAFIHIGLGSSYWQSWEHWFWGEASANLVIPPFILYWVLSPPNWRSISARQRIEAALLLCGLLLSLWLVFTPEPPGFLATRFYLPIVFLVWAALRFGVTGASGAIALLTVFAVRAVLSQHSYLFSEDTPEASVTDMQYFLLLHAAPLYLVAVLIDISRRNEQSLRESERRFRNLADTTPAYIWMTDRNRSLDFFNKGWLDFTGRSLEQERADGWLKSVHPDDLEHCQERVNSSVAAERPFELEYRLRRHDGEYRWVLDRGVPRYTPRGEYLGFIGSCIDVTDRNRADEADRKLRHAARLVALGQLTAVVSHEINQPLCAILSNAEAAKALLKSDIPPVAELDHILSDICRDNARASDVIRVIRGLTLKRTPEIKQVDINELAREIVNLVSADAARRRVELRLELAENLPPVRGDASALEEVFLNLIINAMDAMKDTPARERELSLSTDVWDDQSIVVAVKDRGHGIHAETMPHLFESFFTTKSDGLGLGLSTAWMIVSAHGGRIWAENRTAGGATFFVTVPSADSAGNDAEQMPIRLSQNTSESNRLAKLARSIIS